jgi:hypothetical protein
LNFHLVGGLEHFLFSHILGIIISTDELIFFRGVATTNPRIFHRNHLATGVPPWLIIW